jgi:hypothetical protein
LPSETGKPVRLKAAQDCQYFIADAALYTAQTIQSLDEQKSANLSISGFF